MSDLPNTVTVKTETIVELLGELTFHRLNNEEAVDDDTERAVFDDLGIDWLGYDNPTHPLLLAIHIRAWELRCAENERMDYSGVAREAATLRLMRERGTTAVGREIENLEQAGAFAVPSEVAA